MGYLDNASTTKPHNEVLVAMCDEQTFGNPSSVHKFGQNSSMVIKNAREILSKKINCQPEEIIFTSGGTESINTAIFGAVTKLKKRGNHIISSQIEHTATLNTLKELENRGFEVEYLKPTKDGKIDPKSFANAVREDTILASFMMINNEIGSENDIAKLCKIFKEKTKFGLFHTDAVQALCKTKIDVKNLGVDFLSVSGHKIHGPKGVGALYIKKGTNIPPTIFGGNQQYGIRSGTENTHGINGFSKAIEINNIHDDLSHIESLNQYLKVSLERHFSDDIFYYNGKSDTPYIVNFSIKGIKSEVALRVLEQHEIYVSSGSACTKGKLSYVLLAMEIDRKIADGSIRISFSFNNTKEDIDMLIRGLTVCVEMFK